ncbi:MAG: ion transporter [Planctomycetota bacterium]
MPHRSPDYLNIQRGPIALFCHRVTTHRLFQNAVTALIVFAALVVGLETYPVLAEPREGLFRLVDRIILVLFTIEIVLRIGAYGTKPWRFFKNGWNVFDFVIVAVCLVPIDSQSATALRLVRVVRALRLLTAIPQLQLVIGALLKSIPSIAYVGVLLVLLFYMYAVVGTKLFAGNDPANFGTLERSALSLFRTITLEDWTDLMYSQIHGTDVYPSQVTPAVGPEPKAAPVTSVVFFGSFVLIGTMIVLNLFIGVVINSLTEAQREQAAEALREAGHEHDLQGQLADVESQLVRLTERIAELRERTS